MELGAWSLELGAWSMELGAGDMGHGLMIKLLNGSIDIVRLTTGFDCLILYCYCCRMTSLPDVRQAAELPFTLTL